jgi:hypothetical protein
MPDTHEREPVERRMTNADVAHLHTERRLADMNGMEAWLYRRYRGLPPRGRMLLAGFALVLLLWLAIHGVFAIALHDNRADYLSLTGLVLGTILRAAFRTVPFRYR